MSTQSEDEVQRIRSMMAGTLKDTELRQFVLNVFVDTIELAHQGNPKSWSLATIPRGGLRLQVAYLKMLEIDRDAAFYLVVDTSDLSAEAQRVVQTFKHPHAPELTDTPNAARLLIGSDQAPLVLPVILPAFKKLLLRLRHEVTRLPRSHSPEAARYLAEETHRELPVSPHGASTPRAIDQVRAAMEAAYPDPAVRRLLLGIMADSIELAHEGVPGNWRVSFRDTRNLRLIVGSLSMLFLGTEGNIAKSSISLAINHHGLTEEDAGLAREMKNYEYGSVPGAIAVTIPRDRFDDLLPRFLPAHQLLIKQIRSWKSGYEEAFSPAALEYVRTETGRDLPDPLPGARQPGVSAWKISTGDKGTPVKESLGQGMVGLSLMSHKDVSALPTTSREAYMAALPSTDLAPNHGPLQLWSFLNDVGVGDRVYLYYDGAIRGAGEITSDYYYDPGVTYPHRRNVRWADNGYLPVSKLSSGLSQSLLKSFMTLEKISREQADEIDALINGDGPIGSWQETYARLFPAAGLHYTPWHQAVFFTALQTKGFVILSGISGTGKTKIAQAFAGALPQPEQGRNVAFLTVRPDWRDSKSLIGYHNPITDRYERTPFLDFLLRAVESWERRDGLAWFAILDEMNLAHVEHYFAELLSILESGRDASGWTNEAIQVPVSAGESALPNSIRLPPNLFLVGTVNLDETTHAFSPKVLDRAFAMEFSDVTFEHYAPMKPDAGAPLTDRERRALLDALSNGGAYARIDRTAISTLLAADDRPRRWLQTLNDQLRPHHMHFGFRVFDEIMTFVHFGIGNGLFADLAPDADPIVTAFDAAVLMKVLPKFHGSRSRLEGPLIKVLAWSFQPDKPERAVIDNAIAAHGTPDDLEHTLSLLDYRFPQTATRAARLLWSAYVEGFAAFG